MAAFIPNEGINLEVKVNSQGPGSLLLDGHEVQPGTFRVLTGTTAHLSATGTGFVGWTKGVAGNQQKFLTTSNALEIPSTFDLTVIAQYADGPVHFPPLFLNTNSQDVVLPYGVAYEFSPAIFGVPLPAITWEPQNRQGALSIPFADFSVSGAYSCVASNDAGTVSGPTVTVSVEPLSVATQPRSQSVSLGATVQLIGTFNYRADYQWRRNGELLSGQTNSSSS